jgi:hypothetical protein
MFSGINKKCSACRGECKQHKQITIIICPNYEPKKGLNRRKAHLDPIREPLKLPCNAPERVVVVERAKVGVM